jgi:hypothetical protein
MFLLIIFVLKLYFLLVNLFIQLQTKEIFKYVLKILTHSKIIITINNESHGQEQK